MKNNPDTQFLATHPDDPLRSLDENVASTWGNVNSGDKPPEGSWAPVLENPPIETHSLRETKARKALDRKWNLEDELEDLSEEHLLRENGQKFCRTDNRKIHYFSGLVREHGVYVSALLCHLVMVMRSKVDQHTLRNATEWDPVEAFAQHLGLSDRQTRRVIQKAARAGFIECTRTCRGVAFRILDASLLARQDRQKIDKPLLSFLSLTEAILYTVVFLHTRGIEGQADYPPGKGFATTYHRIAKICPWTDHHGIRTSFNRLIRRGLLERSRAECNARSFRFKVRPAFLAYQAAELAALFGPQKGGERDGRKVNEMADHGERDGRMGEQDDLTNTQGDTGHRVHTDGAQRQARVQDPPSAQPRPLTGSLSSSDEVLNEPASASPRSRQSAEPADSPGNPSSLPQDPSEPGIQSPDTQPPSPTPEISAQALEQIRLIIRHEVQTLLREILLELKRGG